MRSCVQSIEQRKVAARGGSSGASGSDGSSGEIGLAGEGILLIADRQIEILEFLIKQEALPSSMISHWAFMQGLQFDTYYY